MLFSSRYSETTTLLSYTSLSISGVHRLYTYNLMVELVIVRMPLGVISVYTNEQIASESTQKTNTRHLNPKYQISIQCMYHILLLLSNKYFLRFHNRNYFSMFLYYVSCVTESIPVSTWRASMIANGYFILFFV